MDKAGTRERAPTSAASKGRTLAARVALLISILGMLAICGVFVWVTLTTPSDGALVANGVYAWRPDGVAVAELDPQPHGLQTGDIVVAIDGRSLESWSHTLFQPGAAPFHASFGQRVTYTVIRGHQRLNIAVQLGAYPLGAVLRRSWGMLTFLLVFELVGLFVYLRRPAEGAAAALFFSASCFLAASAWLFGLQIINLAGGAAFWLYNASAMGEYLLFWSSLLHFSLTFPRPTALIRARPRLIPLMYALPCGVYLGYLGVTRAVESSALSWIGLWDAGNAYIGTICVALAVTVIAITYRTQADAMTRLKIRWVVFASVISGGGTIFLWFIPWDVFGYRIISANGLGLLLLPFPAALAIAILRYRLFDIDVIINRTLVYGTLTVALAGVYAACVIGLQALAQAVVGQVAIGAKLGHGAFVASPVALVGSTVAIAILFQPLRSSIQTFIDRRFYRSRYDAARLLEAFGATIATEFDLAQLCQRLVAIVEETMQPTSVTLWLRAHDDPADASGAHLWEQAARLDSAAPPLTADDRWAVPATGAALEARETRETRETRAVVGVGAVAGAQTSLVASASGTGNEGTP
jgi:hypothetical protein